MKKIFFIILVIFLGCRKELNISEFSEDYSEYKSELRIEALILPHDSTAIVRIDRSFSIDNITLYDCRDNDYGNISQQACNEIEGAFWHGTSEDTVADCGNWNPFIHDIGSDGRISKDNNSNGKYDEPDDIAPDEDGSEGNGMPDCNEPNVDGYSEILPSVHNDSCKVSITKIDNYDNVETCEFTFSDEGGYFFTNKYTGKGGNPIVDNIEKINYGAYIPRLDFNCNKSFWVDYSAEYSLLADCSESGFPIINSNRSIRLPEPVVFFLVEDSLAIIECSTYDCLKENSSISNFNSDSLLYFGRYSFDSYINYASILPTLEYQAVQYMYDELNDQFIYYHGHPAVGTDMFNIVDSVSVMRETVVSEFYDGYGDGECNEAERRTENESDCSTNEIFLQDSEGGYCDRIIFIYGNEKWDEGETFADENGNGKWDEGEYCIDSADGLPDIDTYYYEIFTFSESYRDYYFNDLLYLNDVERTNLRDQNSNPIMGTFGSMASNKIYFKIIDCTIHDQYDCNDKAITKSVCEWKENLNLSECTGDDSSISIDICMPVNFSIEDCD